MLTKNTQTKDLILASQSQLKINAVTKVFNQYDVQIIALEAESGINPQPVAEETFMGVHNRIEHAELMYLKRQIIANKNPKPFIVLAIENGIFNQQVNNEEIWQDKAVIAAKENGAHIVYEVETEAVTFPNKYVNIAKDRGFDATTVGKVMEEMNVVAKHDDPHISLSNKSRQQYLEEALTDLAKTLEARRIIQLKQL